MDELVNIVLAVTFVLDVTLGDVYEGRSVPFAIIVSAVRADKEVESRPRRGTVDLSRWPVEYFMDANRAPITVFGQGNELHHRDRVIFGNLFIRVNVLPHPLYRMDMFGWSGFAYDLHASIVVTLIDYFEGRVFALPHPSGRRDAPPIMVEYQGGDNIKTFNGRGMRGKGVLYVHFDLALPKTRDEREALRDNIIAVRMAWQRLGIQ
jgi:hypothetical protein